MGIIIKTIKRSYSSDMRKEDENKIINDFMERHNIINYTINPDKSVDVDGDIYIEKEDLIDGKLPFKFGEVIGKFKCSDNKLTSLEGCPKIVDGGFYCSNNNLTSLEGCPKIIGGNFYCSINRLTSLEGCPEEVGGNFSCYGNQLTSLEGCPKKVGGDFFCKNNYILFTVDEVEQYCNVGGGIWEQ